MLRKRREREETTSVDKDKGYLAPRYGNHSSKFRKRKRKTVQISEPLFEEKEAHPHPIEGYRTGNVSNRDPNLLRYPVLDFESEKKASSQSVKGTSNLPTNTQKEVGSDMWVHLSNWVLSNQVSSTIQANNKDDFFVKFYKNFQNRGRKEVKIRNPGSKIWSAEDTSRYEKFKDLDYLEDFDRAEREAIQRTEQEIKDHRKNNLMSAIEEIMRIQKIHDLSAKKMMRVKCLVGKHNFGDSKLKRAFSCELEKEMNPEEDPQTVSKPLPEEFTYHVQGKLKDNDHQVYVLRLMDNRALEILIEQTLNEMGLSPENNSSPNIMKTSGLGLSPPLTGGSSPTDKEAHHHQVKKETGSREKKPRRKSCEAYECGGPALKYNRLSYIDNHEELVQTWVQKNCQNVEDSEDHIELEYSNVPWYLTIDPAEKKQYVEAINVIVQKYATFEQEIEVQRKLSKQEIFSSKNSQIYTAKNSINLDDKNEFPDVVAFKRWGNLRRTMESDHKSIKKTREFLVDMVKFKQILSTALEFNLHDELEKQKRSQTRRFSKAESKFKVLRASFIKTTNDTEENREKDDDTLASNPLLNPPQEKKKDTGDDKPIQNISAISHKSNENSQVPQKEKELSKEKEASKPSAELEVGKDPQPIVSQSQAASSRTIENPKPILAAPGRLQRAAQKSLIKKAIVIQDPKSIIHITGHPEVFLRYLDTKLKTKHRLNVNFIRRQTLKRIEQIHREHAALHPHLQEAQEEENTEPLVEPDLPPPKSRLELLEERNKKVLESMRQGDDVRFHVLSERVTKDNHTSSQLIKHSCARSSTRPSEGPFDRPDSWVSQTSRIKKNRMLSERSPSKASKEDIPDACLEAVSEYLPDKYSQSKNEGFHKNKSQSTNFHKSKPRILFGKSLLRQTDSSNNTQKTNRSTTSKEGPPSQSLKSARLSSFRISKDRTYLSSSKGFLGGQSMGSLLKSQHQRQLSNPYLQKQYYRLAQGAVAG